MGDLTICVYEDDVIESFYPLTYTRPVYAMRAGIVPLCKRLSWHFDGAPICVAARNQLAGLVATELRDFPVNILQRGENHAVLFVNGRVRDYGDLPKLVSDARLTTVFRSRGEIAAVLIKADSAAEVPKLATPDEYVKSLVRQREELAEYDTTATLYRHCWEIMHDAEAAITDEYPHVVNLADEPTDVLVHESFSVLNKEQVFLGTGVKAGPGSIIDASHGPVFIGDYTRIEPQAAIFGPTYIGPNSVVVAGKIAGSSIGHTCRVGGEVEESIFQAYVNKYHAGFIGHSYVGSWVNFGAMTTNSDLKNNYSNIRVSLSGESVDTGSIKVGSFIGDHTKFGIGTLLNTGINIGVCCNLFGGTLIADKEVPSFTWGATGSYQPYDVEKAIETARRTAGRRDVELSDQEEKVLRAVAAGEISKEGVLDWNTVLQ